ncbi:uncharacterized protein [Venturia canescens]|uniref:uncharacterized protein n=1 Tax=Venturia canescens TaxID=32260 RepID=UPI001C9C2D18|nr:uncharacterized protein LOC122416025 [Venturia canescens]
MLTNNLNEGNAKVVALLDEDRAKLLKIRHLTNILKETDKNLTTCEEILATYLQKKLQDKRRDTERRKELESKMTEILDNLKTRLIVE